ncbi:MAG: hypothetical protein AAFX99_00645 [Myxococcota bacterium]
MFQYVEIVLLCAVVAGVGCGCLACLDGDREERMAEPPPRSEDQPPMEDEAVPPKSSGQTSIDGATSSPQEDSPKSVPEIVEDGASPCGRAHPGVLPSNTPVGASKHTPAQIAARCAGACDGARFIVEARARCVAQQRGLAKGVKPWELDLDCDTTLRRPVWRVLNEEGKGTVMLGDGSKANSIYGFAVVVDACSAEVVSYEPWSVAF